FVLLMLHGSARLKQVRQSAGELRRVVGWTAVSFFLVVLTCLVLLPFNQTEEAMRVAFDPIAGASSRLWLFAGTLLFSCSVWYLSRSLVVVSMEYSNTIPELADGTASIPHLKFWGALL